MCAGLIGVPMGSFLAQRKRESIPNVDPLICAYALIGSAPLVYIVLLTADSSTAWSFVFVFFAMLSLNFCWSLVADMLLVRHGRRKDDVDGPGMINSNKDSRVRVNWQGRV